MSGKIWGKIFFEDFWQNATPYYVPIVVYHVSNNNNGYSLPTYDDASKIVNRFLECIALQ